MKDYTGRRVGLLTVCGEAPRSHNGERQWLCLCDCGNLRLARQSNIFRTSVSKNASCGCVGKRKKYQTLSVRYYRRLYHVWCQMKKRCSQPTHEDYPTYGGRGIAISTEWHDFGQFYNDMIESYQPGLTLERIDVNGNYELSNCTWITNEAQAKNRRTTRWINGMCAKDACRAAGINYGTFMQRLRSGKTIKQAFHEC